MKYIPHSFYPLLGITRLILLGLIFWTPTLAANWTAEASISQTEVGTGETFQIIVQVQSEKKQEATNWPELKGDLSAFTVEKSTGSSQSSQTTIINGKISQSSIYITQYTFSLKTSKPGVYTLGPISYTQDGQTQNMGSAQVKVATVEAAIGLEVSLRPTESYIGQQVFYNLRLIEKNPIRNISVPELQKTIGNSFYFQYLDNDIKVKQVVIEGTPRKVWDIPIALFPLVQGSQEIPALSVKYQQLQQSRPRSRSVFDVFESQFFGGQVVEREASTGRKSLRIKPLPEGAPVGFTGAVGNYTLSSSISASEIKTGDALTLTITIRGNGQPKAISKPILPNLKGFEVFDPEETTQSKIQGNMVYTEKTFKYALIAAKEGQFNFKDIGFAYFDPTSKSYKIAQDQPLMVKVLPGKIVSTSTARTLSQQELLEVGNDIRHIKSYTPQIQTLVMPYRSVWYYLVLFIFPLLYLLLLFQHYQSQKMNSDQALLRKSKANSELKKRLKESKLALEAGDARKFYHHLHACIERFGSDKINEELRGKTDDELRQTLSRHGLSEKSTQQFWTIYEQCNQGMYAGLGNSIDQMKNLFQQAEVLLEAMNKELKK